MIYSKRIFCYLICASIVFMCIYFGSGNAYASDVTYYKSGNKVKISYRDTLEYASFIIAKYNFDDSLVDCSINKITSHDGQYTSSTISLSEQYKYKFMLWEFQQLKPLSQSLSIDVNTPDTTTSDDGYTNRY